MIKFFFNTVTVQREFFSPCWSNGCSHNLERIWQTWCFRRTGLHLIGTAMSVVFLMRDSLMVGSATVLRMT
jgi:hypothetical protein